MVLFFCRLFELYCWTLLSTQLPLFHARSTMELPPLELYGMSLRTVRPQFWLDALLYQCADVLPLLPELKRLIADYCVGLPPLADRVAVLPSLNDASAQSRPANIALLRPHERHRGSNTAY